MDNKEIGRRLSLRRTELNLTLQDVAKRIGVASSTVLRYETGAVQKIKMPVIEAISKALGLNPSWVCGKEVNKFLENKGLNNITPVTGIVPILGGIPAGVPVLAQENIEGYLPVVVKNPEEYFSLRVHGTSMINAGIPDGSLVLIHQQPDAEDGQIVACRVNGDEATLKRFKRVGDTVFLMPDNPEFDPIIVKCSDFNSGYAEIIGVAKQVITELK